MGELQVFSLVADPTWHSLIWAPTCFNCRAAKLSLFALERLVGFGWVPYAILVTRSIACFRFLEAIITWASHWIYLYPESDFSLYILTETLRWPSVPFSCSIQEPIDSVLAPCVCHQFLFAFLFFLFLLIYHFSSLHLHNAL